MHGESIPSAGGNPTYTVSAEIMERADRVSVIVLERMGEYLRPGKNGL